MTSKSSAGGAAAAGGVDFQALVGAYLAVRVLGEASIPSLWSLPATVVLTRIWAESGAPVDDVLATTSANGAIFVQAKRTVGMSDRLDSPFGEAFQQFTKLYLTAAEFRHPGTNEKRTLDPSRDRIVLATSSATAPVEHLVSILRRARELGTVLRPRDCTVNADERAALAKVISLTRRCWRLTTNASPGWSDILPFLQLIWISVFRLDQGDTDEQLANYWLRDKILLKQDQADSAWKVLKDKAIGLAKGRSGIERSELQQTLLADGFALQALRSYQADVERLKEQTRTNLRALSRFSRITYDGIDVTIRRDYEAILYQEAEAGSLIVIGEAGCGKSGLLGVLAARLNEEGRHLIVLNAGELWAPSLGQLREDLNLEHELIDVIEQWHGEGPAFLVIDALDSARDERTAETLRRLIERAEDLKGRWRVVATIRKFDLKNGRHWRELMPGQGIRPHFDPAFDHVRHLNVERLSLAEVESLRDSAPGLHAMIAAAPPAVADLIRVPFNLMLANELRRVGAPSDLNTATTQLRLLDRYWDRRLNASPSGRATTEEAMRDVTEAMVKTRRLSVDSAAVTRSPSIEAMLSESVLTEYGRRLQYQHHILFDYGVERLLLRPDDDATIARLESDRDLPVAVGPSLKYWLEGSWERDRTRNAFWLLSLRLASSTAPAIAKIVSGTVAAEKTEEPVDCKDLVAVVGTEPGQRLFMSVADAVTAGIDRIAKRRPNVWFTIIEQLVPAATPAVLHRAAFLLHALLDSTVPLLPGELSAAGRFARAALAVAWSATSRNRSFVVAALRATARTFRSDVPEAERLLRQALRPDHVQVHGHEELQWLARHVVEFLASPTFLTDLYAATFAATASADEATTMSNSQIHGLISNKKQDLEGAQWQLGQSFVAITKQDISLATAIAVRLANQYVAAQDVTFSTSERVTFKIHGTAAQLHPDHYLSSRGTRDEEPEMARTLAQELARLSADRLRRPEFDELLRYIAVNNQTTLLWKQVIDASINSAALFHAVRDAMFAPSLLSLFSKSFILALRAHRAALSSQDRGQVQAAILSLRDAGYGDVTAFRLLDALGPDGLSDDAADWLQQMNAERLKANNVAHTAIKGNGTGGDIAPAQSEDDIDDDAGTYVLREGGMKPEDLRADVNRTARRRTRELRSQVTPNAQPTKEILASVEQDLSELETYLRNQPVHPAQVGRSWGAIAEVATWLAQNGVDSVAETLVLASQRPEPVYDSEQEKQFARSASWGSGQARMEAAPGLIAIAARSDNATVLSAVQTLARDPVSSVRFAIGRELHGLAAMHPATYWTLLESLVRDKSQTVVGWLELGHALWLDPTRGRDLVVRTYEHWAPRVIDHASLVEELFNLLLGHWLRTGDHAAGWIVAKATDDVVSNAGLIGHAVMSLRTSMTQPQDGDETDPAADAFRKRSITYVSEVTSAAVARLRSLEKASGGDSEREQFRTTARLLIDITQEMYFASLAYDEKNKAKRATPDPKVRARFFNETRGILRELATVGTAGSSHYLIETLGSFIDLADPVEVFLLIAEAVRAGRKGGYQYESLAVKEIVTIIERYLADFRVIFMENEECRAGLRDILDTFVEAGWPETHRLVYSLDSIFR